MHIRIEHGLCCKFKNSDSSTCLRDLENPDINMDKNETAIFVYNGKYFVDPGFVRPRIH